MDLHGDTDDTVRGIPEADVAGVRAAFWWPPWHGEDVDLEKDEEDDGDVPRLELGAAEVGTLASGTDDVDADGHGEVEDAVRIRLQTDDFGSVSHFDYVFWRVNDTDQTGTRPRRGEQQS